MVHQTELLGRGPWQAFGADGLRTLIGVKYLSGDIQELRAALAQDSRPTATDKFGPKVSSWMGTMLNKAAEGAWNTTLEVGSKVLVEAITKYYGIS
jgi:hypothetical protein